MIKVIGHKHWFKTACDCGAILVYQEEDIKDNYTENNGRPFGPEYEEYYVGHIVCPECGNKINVSDPKGEYVKFVDKYGKDLNDKYLKDK